MTKYLGVILVVLGTIMLVGGYLTGTFVAHDGLSFGGFHFSVLLGFLFSGVWLHIISHKGTLNNGITKRAGVVGIACSFLLPFIAVALFFGSGILLNETGWGLDMYLSENGASTTGLIKTICSLLALLALVIFIVIYRFNRNKVQNPKAYLYSFIAGFVLANTIHIIYNVIMASSGNADAPQA